MIYAFGGPVSPCIGCGRKDYKNGCHKGCHARDEYLREKARIAAAKRRSYETRELLSAGAIKEIRKRDGG